MAVFIHCDGSPSGPQSKRKEGSNILSSLGDGEDGEGGEGGEGGGGACASTIWTTKIFEKANKPIVKYFHNL